ncbi:MAG: STAS domain-containing protein [bacterium]
MNLHTKTLEDYLVIEFDGRLDAVTADEVEVQIFDLINRGSKNIILDFSNLTFISSLGLRVVLATLKKIKALGGKLRVCNMNEEITEVFDISGFNSIFSIFESLDKALAS